MGGLLVGAAGGGTLVELAGTAFPLLSNHLRPAACSGLHPYTSRQASRQASHHQASVRSDFPMPVPSKRLSHVEDSRRTRDK